jgi:hypothetical protein
LELRQDTGTCTQGQKGSILRVSTITNAQPKEITQESPCVEDAVSPSAATRSQFQIDVSPGHLKVYMPGTSVVWYDGPLSLGFNQAVVQFSHHSYNPLKGENPVGGPAAPNTFHWSDVAITPAAPFTMLRPEQPFSLHEGQDPVLKLPQAAPQGSYLRFAGLGNFEVSADGGKSWQPARVQGANRAPEHFASYWTPVPAGTTEVSIRGQRNASNLPWWVEDVSVWAQGSTAPVPAPRPTPQPTQAPTPQPTPVTTPPPTPQPTPSGTPVGAPPPQPSGSIDFRAYSRSIYFPAARRPAHVTKGDLLLASLAVDADPVKVGAPPGWTLLGDTTVAGGTKKAFHVLVYFRVAGAHEPSYYQFSRPWGVWADLQVLAYRGVDPGRPIDAVAARDAGITTTPTSPPLNVSSSGDRLVLIFVDHDYTRWTPPIGMVERTDFDGNMAADAALSSAGSVASRSALASRSGPMAAIAVALRSA